MPHQEEAEKIKDTANSQVIGHTINGACYTAVPQGCPEGMEGCHLELKIPSPAHRNPDQHSFLTSTLFTVSALMKARGSFPHHYKDLANFPPIIVVSL